MSTTRSYCAGSNGQPIVIPVGGDLYQQASLISSCFKNPIIDCTTVGVDGTQNFCFDVTPDGGGTPQWIAVSLQSVNGIVNPDSAVVSVATAKSRAAEALASAPRTSASSPPPNCSGSDCQYLANQTAPCGSNYGADCQTDSSCSQPNHPGCQGCCNNPFGAVYQAYATESQIQTNCTQSVVNTSVLPFCLPCPPGAVPVIRPCGNDCETITYYTCSYQPVSVALTCNAVSAGTMDYAVTDASGNTLSSGSLSTNSTSTAQVIMNDGDTITITNLTAMVPLQEAPGCIGFQGEAPKNQVATFNSFYYTYTNISDPISASITFTGTCCRVDQPCSDRTSGVACPGTLEVQISGFTGVPSIVGSATVQSSSTCASFRCGWSSGDPTVAAS